MLDRQEYIDLADLLENHNTPPGSSLDRDWRFVTSFHSCPAYSQKRRAIPTDLTARCSMGGSLAPLLATTPSAPICNP